MSNCTKCGAVMVELRSEDKKVCSNGACGHEEAWPLKEGDRSMFKNDVEPFVRFTDAELRQREQEADE